MATRHRQRGTSGRPSSSDGRIAFRIRIGVTGHVALEPTDAVVQTLHETFKRIQRQLLLDVATPSTPIRLAVVTQLAEGPDRWVAQEAMRFGDACDQPVRLEVILPMCRRAYIERQGFDDASRTEFEALLEQAASVYEPRGVDPLTDEEAYEAAGHRLVRRCDVLISVWDGTASRGRGGTAETLVHAAWLGKPCIWIRPEHGSAVASDNISDAAPDRFYAVVCDGAQTHPLRPPDLDHDALSSLKDSYRGLDELNRTPNRSGFEDRLAERLQEDPAGEWIASSLVRASMLAGWYHRTFRTLAWSISALAIFAAAMVGASVSVWESTYAAVLEVLFLTAATGGFAVLHLRALHRRWLTYRFLAEQLRSAYYVAPTGADMRRVAALEGVYVERHAEDAVIRAFVEVWDGRPHRAGTGRTPRVDDLISLRSRLAEAWLETQIAFYDEKGHGHERLDQILRPVVVLSFPAALIFAFAHAVDIWESLSIFLTILLPALGASFGGLLTVMQYKALAKRYGRMAGELAVRQEAIRAATSLQALALASSDAAAVIVQETGGWFSTMWFLDIEHP